MGEDKAIVIKMELEKKLLDEELFRTLGEQLLKDIRLAGLDDQSLETSDPTSMLDSLSQMLELYLKSDAEKLRHFLYRVDLPEQILMDVIGEDNATLKLTTTIILRELKKISDRRKYGSATQ